jgi:hypothetical protein
MHHDGLATLQAAQPVRTLGEPVGHAVRQLYLLAAMADLARERADATLAAACRTLWASLGRGHLYLTGGVGAEPYGEKFSEPFDLPPDRAYAETCAAIGLIFFARRMLDLELRGEYADGIERALYNNVAAGMALDGTKFFYVNPLELIPAVAKRRFECHLVKSQRVGWFGCACCPPNLARLFASLGSYVASFRADGLALHLYAEGELDFTAAGRTVRLAVRTGELQRGKTVARPGPSERSQRAARAAGGVAVQRHGERALAHMGQLQEAAPQFVAAEAVRYGGAMLALPAMLALGLLEAGGEAYGSLKNGFYGLRATLLVLTFMALLRLRTRAAAGPSAAASH